VLRSSGLCPACDDEDRQPLVRERAERRAAANQAQADRERQAEQFARAREMKRRAEQDRRRLVNLINGCERCAGTGREVAGQRLLIFKRWAPCLECQWERERLLELHGEHAPRKRLGLGI